MYLPLAAGPEDDTVSRLSTRHSPSSRCLCAFVLSAALTAFVIVLPSERHRSSHADDKTTSLFAIGLAGGSVWMVVVAVLVVVSLATFLVGHWVLARLVKALIVSFDEQVLGVEVTIEKLETNPLYGRVKAIGLKVDNAPDFDQSFKFLDVQEALFDVNVLTFVKTWGKVLEVEHLVFKHSTAYLQYRDKKWNAEVIMKNLQTSFGLPAETADSGKKTTEAAKLKLRHVKLKGIKLQFRTDVSGIKIEPLPVELGDLDFEDYQKYSTTHPLKLAAEIARFLTETLAKSTLSSAARLGSKAVEAALRTAEHSVDAAKQSVEKAYDQASAVGSQAKAVADKTVRVLAHQSSGMLQTVDAIAHKSSNVLGDFGKGASDVLGKAKDAVEQLEQTTTAQVDAIAHKVSGVIGSTHQKHGREESTQQVSSSSVHPAGHAAPEVRQDSLDVQPITLTASDVENVSASLISKATHAMKDIESQVEGIIHTVIDDSKQDQSSSTSVSSSTAQVFSGPRIPPADRESKAAEEAPVIASQADATTKGAAFPKASTSSHMAASLKEKVEDFESGVQNRIAALTHAASSAQSKTVATRPEQDLLLSQKRGPPPSDLSAAPWPTPSSTGPVEPGRSLGAINNSQAQSPQPKIVSSRPRDGNLPSSPGPQSFMCSLTGIGSALGRLNLCQPHLAPSDSEMRFEPPPPIHQ